MRYSQAKKQATLSVESARAKLVAKLKKSAAFKKLEKELSDFSENAGTGKYDNLSLNESGDLVCSHAVTLPDSLCHDDSGAPDSCLAESVLEAANDGTLYLYQEPGTRGTDSWIAESCFGEPCIVNASPERGCYAVYSRELKLEIMRVESETHGILLAERAMRAAGCFPWLVTCDRYGSCYPLEVPAEIRGMSDAALSKAIDLIENPESVLGIAE